MSSIKDVGGGWAQRKGKDLIETEGEPVRSEGGGYTEEVAKSSCVRYNNNMEKTFGKERIRGIWANQR